MAAKSGNGVSRVLYLPHGGGPLPLLGDVGHKEMVDFLRAVPRDLGNPSAIVLISAHWEEPVPTITSAPRPPLLYDYYGFPKESYEIEYPAPGEPAMAATVYQLLQEHGIKAALDAQRGFDHGMFVPLKVMYPEARIPCVQLSLVRGLDAQTHIQLGKSLSALRTSNILVIGSGFSFHNIHAFFSAGDAGSNARNMSFQQWLIETCTSAELSDSEREQRLARWTKAPEARYCHPREEHLMPLHVCYGIAGSAAHLVFEGSIMGKKACGFLW